VAIPFGAGVLRLRAGDTETIVERARRRPGPHNTRRRFVDQQVVRVLATQYERIQRSAGEPARPSAELLAGLDVEGTLDGDLGVDAGNEFDVEEFGRQVRRSPSSQPRWSACGRVSRPMSCSTTCSGHRPS